MLNADNYAAVRKFHGMGQRQLATTLGVSQSYIAQVESGSRPLSENLRARTIQALALTPEKLAPIIAAQEEYEAARENFLK